jgi:hypothetical protein
MYHKFEQARVAELEAASNIVTQMQTTYAVGFAAGFAAANDANKK